MTMIKLITASLLILTFPALAISLRTPETPLLPQAIEVEFGNDLSFLTDDELGRVWELRRAADQNFANTGAIGQLGYLKIGPSGCHSVQVAPYYLPSYMDYPVLRSIASLWQQVRAVLNTLFGSTQATTAVALPAAVASVDVKRTGGGALVEQEVIDKQLVWQGRNINVLYNFRPIKTATQVHLLLVVKPERPGRNFGEISREDYIEVLDVARAIDQRAREVWKDQKEEVETYIFDKTGSFAGQTQPIYHAHVVVTLGAKDSTWGKLRLLWRMVWTPAALKDDKLREARDSMRTLFAEALEDDAVAAM